MLMENQGTQTDRSQCFLLHCRDGGQSTGKLRTWNCGWIPERRELHGDKLQKSARGTLEAAAIGYFATQA